MSKLPVRVEGVVCVGRDGDNYVFVSSIFKHRDGFQGCTGFVVRPVSKEEYDSNTFADIHEMLSDAGMHEGLNCAEFSKLVSDAIQLDGYEHLVYDSSYVCEASAFFEAWGIEYECTDCNSCGRIFSEDSDYDEIVNHEAYAAVKWFEGGKFSFESAACAIFGGEALREVC